MSAPPDDKAYLSALYNQLWANLVGAETRLLQFLGLYGVAIGLILNAAPRALPHGFVSIAATLISIWVALVALDANHWSQRNHAIIVLAERAMVSQDLLDKLIPKHYRGLRYDCGSIYSIHLSFVGVVAAGLVISGFLMDKNFVVIYPFVLYVVGLLLVRNRYNTLRARFRQEFATADPFLTTLSLPESLK